MSDQADFGAVVREKMASLGQELPQVTVKVRTRGQQFACYATVMQGRNTLHTTGDFPFTSRANAFAAGKAWAEKNHFRV